MKYKFLTSLLFIFFISLSFAQNSIDTIVENKQIFIKLNNNYSKKKIKPHHKVTVWIKEDNGSSLDLQTQKQFGKMIYLNDSIVLVNTTEVSVNSIEKIKLENHVASFFGGITSVMGTFITIAGSQMMKSSEITEIVFGLMAVGAGGIITLSGIIVYVISRKKYNMDKYQLYFELK